MEGLRVAIVSERAGSEVPGGIGRYASELVSALGDELDQPPEVVGPPRHRHARTFTLAAWQFVGFPRLQTRSHVVHATSLAVPPTPRHLVVTVHDLYFVKAPHAYTRWGVAFHLRGLERTARSAQVVITPTEAVRDELLERFPAFEGRVRAIHHGVPSFCMASDDSPRKPPKFPYFLWVGTIEPRKNLHRLLRAFSLVGRRSPAPGLVLAGKVGWKIRPGSLLAGLPERVRERVEFVGDPDDATLRNLYRNAVALVYPSLDEGFGFPTLEAMASGTPVVTSDIPVMREVVGEAGLLVEPTRVKAIAEAMEAVLRESALASRLSELGLARAARFDWEESARLHLRAYEDALGGA